MERFNELKVKGWVNLNQDEKVEYQALKPKGNTKSDLDFEITKVNSNGSGEAKLKSKPETVTMTKEDLRRLIDEARQSSVNQDGSLRVGQWTKKREEKKSNPMATMRLYREDGLSKSGLIVDWKFVRNIENVDTRKFDVPVYQIQVKYGDEFKAYEIPLEELVKINEVEKVEIIKQVIDVQEMKQGVGQKPFSNSGYNYSSPGFFGTKQQNAPGEEFDYVVTRKDIVCTIKRPNGEVFEIHSSRLNQ